MKQQIGELNEKSLHASLKAWYARPGDQVEVEVDGYVVDILQNGQLIEIQTGNFSSVKEKFRRLARTHDLKLVYPIAQEKWLYKLPKADWEGPRRRKSPKRGRVEEIFRELVSFPDLILSDHFTLEVVMIQEEEVRKFTGRKMWWRNGWEPVERRLLQVLDQRIFHSPEGIGELLPEDLPVEFTTRDLAQALNGPRWLGQKMAYCLRKVGFLTQVGKKGRSNLYIVSSAGRT
ncbi:MAG: hypothetical protein KGY39_06065 [Anaerolineales bacterium]|nr:hypothetical protein [Anaerolineales bacterium]MBS3753028.1 hypothetical protein [Anaerolineales bacterium]